MRVLALETSQRQASLAALETAGSSVEAAVVEQHVLSSEQRTAQALLPAIQQLLAKCNWQAAEVDLICVSTGPGSFTGLRMGVTTAKTLAYATGAQLVGVHTLAAIAARTATHPGRLWTILDAQRQELFAACFSEDSDQPLQTEVLPVGNWLARLLPGDTVCGPPLTKLLDRLPPDVTATNNKTWSPRAIEVGQLGIAAYARGETTNPMQLVPQYFRRSAAEEKADL